MEKKIGMLWKNYGKAMEFLFWGSVRTLNLEEKKDKLHTWGVRFSVQSLCQIFESAIFWVEIFYYDLVYQRAHNSTFSEGDNSMWQHYQLGAYVGLSSVRILTYFPLAILTCQCSFANALIFFYITKVKLI